MRTRTSTARSSSSSKRALPYSLFCRLIPCSLTSFVDSIHRLNEEEARSLFNAIVKHVEASEELGVTEWKGDLGELGHKRKVWWNNNEDAGRELTLYSGTCLNSHTLDAQARSSDLLSRLLSSSGWMTTISERQLNIFQTIL